MDSVTQFTLGAAVSALILGKKIGPRKAALIGGVLGTLPDLDVLIPFETPVDDFVFHRGWTHSFFVQAAVTPIFGEALMRLFDGLRDARWRTYLAVFLVFVTHSIIDAITIYGTRVFWPVYPDPVGVGSMFIIDPIYTIPILSAVVWALFMASETRRFRKVLVGALVVSTAYMGLSLVLQQIVENRAKTIFAEAGIETGNLIATAGPLNTLVWRVIAREDDAYHNLYVSLLDSEPETQIYTHPRNPELAACLNGNAEFEKLQWFSRGYYTASLEGDRIVISDIRMGLTPFYVFRFELAEFVDAQAMPITPVQTASDGRAAPGDWQWLQERLWGQPATRTVEAALSESNVPITATC
ncbi:MAG: metal-dependent hydrolase [Pseudomonadota bacterium]